MLLSKKFKTIIFPAILGNILEWYDFTLYAYFASIFAKLYFPAGDSFISLLEVYGLFAVSYIMRPVGALVFGYIGDTKGRKYSLAYSVILMGACSFALSVLPTYQDWGLFASISLALIRLAQGFAVGGEYSGATIFLIESAPKNKHTFYGSLALSSAYSGFLLSSAVGASLSIMFTPDQLLNWGWRLGFVFGGFIAMIGFYVRNKLKDTLSHSTKASQQKKINPLKNLLYYHPKTFVLALGIAILPAGFSYMIFVYFNNFLAVYAQYTVKQILIMNVVTMTAAVILIPFIGLIADFIGRRTLMITAALAIMILCIPLFSILILHPFIIFIMFTLLNALYEANIPTEIAEMFEADYRYSGLGLTLNLTNGIAGGFAPMIASILVHSTHQQISPMYYVIGLSVITLVSLVVNRK